MILTCHLLTLRTGLGVTNDTDIFQIDYGLSSSFSELVQILEIN